MPCRRQFLAAATALPAVGTPARSEPAKPFRVYAVGNSVTDALNYTAFAELLRSRGFAPTVARQMIPGAPLEWLWNHPADGFKVDPFGYPREAFPKHRWDAVTLQPFDRHLDSDVKHAAAFIDLARKNLANADAAFWVYARWPRMSKGGKGVQFDRNNFGKTAADPNKITDYKQLDRWTDLWGRKYTGGWDGSNESRDYFETLTRKLRTDRPGMRVGMVPVGHVLAKLDGLMATGKVPGFTSVWDLYTDGIHFGPVGSYVVGVTFFAALTGGDPVGLPTAPCGTITPAAAKAIQETARDVVAATELAKVP
jgi:hypothetical protein